MLVLTFFLFQFTERVVQALFARSRSRALRLQARKKGDVNRNFSLNANTSSSSPPAKMSLEDKFNAAVKVIHSLPKDGPYQPSNSVKLKFYGLFKQATEGPCNTAKPGFWDIVGKYKWEAWDKLGEMSKEEAMTTYVENLKEVMSARFEDNIVETMSLDDNIQEFLNTIGPFYEFVNMQGDKMGKIKETIERLSSSCSSSGSPSPIGSPVKEGKVEVEVETGTATYEPIPYANQNGHAKEDIEDDGEEEDVLGVTITNGFEVGVTPEPDSEVATNQAELTEPRPCCSQSLLDHVPTSGTESEKYYSGDSEPDFEPVHKYIPERQQGVQQQIPNGHLVLQDPSLKRERPRRSSPKGEKGSSDVVLDRLHRDVDHILARLRILESAYANQAGTVGVADRRRRSGPFGLSYPALALILLWPFAANFLLKAIAFWWRRRRNMRRM